MIKAVLRGLAATKKGSILLHPSRWKNLQAVVVGAVSVGLAGKEAACVVSSSCFGLTDTNVHLYAQVLAWIAFGAYNLWSIWATSEKVGWGGKVQEIVEVIAHATEGDAGVITRPPVDANPNELRERQRPTRVREVSSAVGRGKRGDSTGGSSRPFKSSLDQFSGD